MNAPAKPSAVVFGAPGFDLRKICEGTLGKEDGSVDDLPNPDAKPLPSLSDLPDLDWGIENLIDQLIALQASDVEVQLRDIRIDPATGMMRRDGKDKSVAYTPSALTQLCYFWNSKMRLPQAPLPRSPAANLLWYRPAVRAAMVDDIRSKLYADRKVTVRLLCLATPICRAVTSDVHTGNDGDTMAFAQELRRVLGNYGSSIDRQDARLWASWAWDTSRITVYFGVSQTGVRAVANISLSETKAHAWFATGGVHVAGRTYWGWAPAQHAHGRHVGTRVARRMVEATLASYAMRDQVIGALEAASEMQVTAEIFSGLARRFQIPDVLNGVAIPEGATLRQILDLLYDVENKGQQLHPDTRQQLREGLGRLLQSISENGIAGLER